MTHEQAAMAQPAPATEEADAVPERFNQWSLQLAAGPSFMVGPGWSATGAIARFGAIGHAWRGHFLIGGGPTVSHWYARDAVHDDTIHLTTLNGDLVIGGGVANKFALYGHATLGLGYLSARDGATGIRIKMPGGRSSAGMGGHVYLGNRFSVGGLVDFNFWGGLSVDAVVTLNVHFGRKAKS